MNKSKKEQIEESAMAFIKTIKEDIIDPRIIQYSCDGQTYNYQTYGYYGCKSYENKVVCELLNRNFIKVKNSEKILQNVHANKSLIRIR